MTPVAAILGGAQAATSIYGALRGRKRGPSVQSIDDRFRNERVSGYLTPEDRAMVERTRLAGVQGAERSADLTRQSVYRQVAGRHLSGASAAAMGLRADEQAAEGRDQANLAAANEEYGLYKGNEGYEREKQATAWGNEVGDAVRGNARADLQDSTFWNSALESIPAIRSLWSGLGGTKMATDLNPESYGGTRGRDLTLR